MELLHRTQEQPLRRTQPQLATALYEGAAASPLTDQAAYRESRDVRCIRQLFIGDIEENTTRRFLANCAGKTSDYLSNTLSSGIASYAHVGGEMPGDIIRSGQ